MICGYKSIFIEIKSRTRTPGSGKKKKKKKKKQIETYRHIDSIYYTRRTKPKLSQNFI
jgi:hypothetical protein